MSTPSEGNRALAVNVLDGIGVVPNEAVIFEETAFWLRDSNNLLFEISFVSKSGDVMLSETDQKLELAPPSHAQHCSVELNPVLLYESPQ